MRYDRTIIAKNGREIHLRNADAFDGNAIQELFQLTHGETDYLLSYPDENKHDLEERSRLLAEKAESPNAIELLALDGSKLIASAGIHGVGTKYKVAHRAEFGISVLKAYWGLGIGRALMEACIQCAKDAGHVQLELDVVADNTRAIGMYHKAGFVEYGRNPKGFRSRTGAFQEVVSMRAEL